MASLQKRTGYRSDKTVRAALNGLVIKGLIARKAHHNSPLGDKYKVLQKTITGVPEYRSTPVENTAVLESKITGHLNTSEDTKHIDDDDGLSDLASALRVAARDVIGGDLPQSEQERERWREVGNLLADELKRAAERAGAVSSAPAFLAAHLRRRFKASSAKPTKADRQLTKSQAASLTKEQKLLKMIKEIRQLHVGDAGYEQADLIEDLKYKCERQGIEWDEELVNRLLGSDAEGN